MSENLNLKNIIDQSSQIIVKAGELLISHFNKSLEKINKSNHQGFVTQADTDTERFLIDNLGKILIEASFWAEESGQSGISKSGYCWVIDPLDGTTNFAYGIPYFCISIALTHNNLPILAVVYDPLRKELFTAIKNQGAYLNNKKITVSGVKSLDKAFVFISTPYSRDHEYKKLLDLSQDIRLKAYDTRQLGSIVLDAAYVACGRADGFYCALLGWWDVAAGVLLIQEAGGTICQFDGALVGPDYITCLGASPSIYKDLQAILNKF